MNSFKTRSFDTLDRGNLNAKASYHFFDERFFDEPFFVDRFFEPFFDPFLEPFFEPFLAGTFPPSRRASDSPIAIACFLLVTFLPERPLFNVPSLRSCIAFSTFSLAFFPYLAIAVTSPGPSTSITTVWINYSRSHLYRWTTL